MQNYQSLSATDRLLSFGWEGRDVPEAGLLKTHISHLRRKLRDAGGEAFDIQSRHSLGYTLELAG
jgi:DNA-binding response OmpR family regulator